MLSISSGPDSRTLTTLADAERTEYELRHLCKHLTAAKNVAGWQRLLRARTPSGKNAWFALKFSRGAVATFFDDLDLALSHPNLLDGAALTVHVRASLYYSLRAALGRLSSSLLDDLTDAGVWSEREADGVRILAGLVNRSPASVNNPSVAAPTTREVAERLLGEARAMWSMERKANALIALVPHFASQLRQEVLDEARLVVLSEEWYREVERRTELMHPRSVGLYRVRALLALAKSDASNRMPLATEALAHAVAMAGSEYGYCAVQEVAEVGGGALVPTIERAVANWAGTPLAFVLMTLSKLVSGEDRASLCERALTELETNVRDSELWDIALIDLIALLPVGLLARGKALAMRHVEDPFQADVLTAFACRADWQGSSDLLHAAIESICRDVNDELLTRIGATIPTSRLPEVYDAISRIGAGSARVWAYAILLPIVPSLARGALLAGLLSAAGDLSRLDKPNAVQRLIERIEPLDDTYKGEVLAVAQSIADTIDNVRERVETNARIERARSSTLDAETTRKRLRAAISSSSRELIVAAQLLMLATLRFREEISQPPDTLLEVRFVGVLETLLRERHRAISPWRLLHGFAKLISERSPVGPTGVLARMVEVARQVAEPLERADALISVGRLSGPLFDDLLEEARAAIVSIVDAKERTEGFVGLADVCPPPRAIRLLDEAEAELVSMPGNDTERLREWIAQCREGVRQKQTSEKGSRGSEQRTAFTISFRSLAGFGFDPISGFGRDRRVLGRDLLGQDAVFPTTITFNAAYISVPPAAHIRALANLARRFPGHLAELLTEALAICQTSLLSSDDRLCVIEALLTFGEAARDYIVEYATLLCPSDCVEAVNQYHPDLGEELLVRSFASLAEELTQTTCTYGLAGRCARILPLLVQRDRDDLLSRIENLWARSNSRTSDLVSLRLVQAQFATSEAGRTIARDLLAGVKLEYCVDRLSVLSQLAQIDRSLVRTSIAELELDILQSVPNEQLAGALSALSELLPAGVISNALGRIQEYCASHSHQLPAVLHALRPILDHSTALSWPIPSTWRDEERATALTSIALHLPPRERAIVMHNELILASMIYDNRSRFRALRAVACGALKVTVAEQSELVMAALRASARGDHLAAYGQQRHALETIAAMADLIERVGGRSAVADAIVGISETDEWHF